MVLIGIEADAMIYESEQSAVRVGRQIAAVSIPALVMCQAGAPANGTEQIYRWAYAMAQAQVAMLEARQRWLRSIEPSRN
jgi:hypothetical protein